MSSVPRSELLLLGAGYLGSRIAMRAWPETDDTPFLTAMCTVTAPGVIALSRDLLRTFTPGAPA